MKHLENILKSCSRDQKAYEKLKMLTDKLNQEKKDAELRLHLLERSIRDDYDAIMITTLDLEDPEIVYVNSGFTAITGYTPDEVIGKTPRILQGPKTDRAVLHKLKQRLKEGQAFFGHTVNYKKDGTEFINQWDIHPLLNDQEEVTHWVSYQHDITERKRSEQKLIDLEIKFDDLSEESKKIWADVNAEGKFVTSNKAFRTLLGYEAEELEDIHFWQIITDEYKQDFKNRFFDLTGESSRLYEFEIKTRTGKHVEVAAGIRMVQSSDGKLIRFTIENKSVQKRISELLGRRFKDLMSDQAKDFNYRLIPHSDGNYIIQYTSARFEDVTEMAPGEVKDLPFHELVHDEDVNKWKIHADMVCRGKSHTEQFRMKTKRGGYIEVVDYAKPEKGTDSEMTDAVRGTISTEISSEKK